MKLYSQLTITNILLYTLFFDPRFATYTTTYERFINIIVSGLAAGQPIYVWPDIFLQVTSPSLPGRAVLFYYKYNAYYLRGLLFALVVYTLCGA